MKNLEKVRSRLNRAISSGRSKSDILGISRRLDVLIVEEMKQQIIKRVHSCAMKNLLQMTYYEQPIKNGLLV